MPETEVTVVDAETGQPVEGAVVQIQRYRTGPPPSGVVGGVDRLSDNEGEMKVEEETVRQAIYPLCMHGIPFYAFVVCVSHEEYEKFVSDLVIESELPDPWELTVELSPGDSNSCGDIDEKAW